MNQRKNSTILFPAVLFCAFAFCSFLVLLYGIHAYQKIQDHADINYGQSVPLTYLTNKVHSSDGEGSIFVETIDGTSCLVLVTNSDEVYHDYIYVQDGSLHELLIPASREVNLHEGLPVMELDSLDITQSGNTITFAIEAQGERKHQQVTLRSF